MEYYGIVSAYANTTLFCLFRFFHDKFNYFFKYNGHKQI